MTPTEFRRPQRKELPASFPEISFRLNYRPPFDWEQLLAFLAQRTIPHVEAVQDGAYARTVRIKRPDRDFIGHIRVGHQAGEHSLSVRLSEGLLPVCAVVRERVRRLFDLHANPAAIDLVLGELSAERPGLRVPGSFDGFELAVRAVLGQQISVAGARTLAGRLALRFGTPVDAPVPSLTCLFPAPERLASATADQIGRLGITGRRASTLIALARAISKNDLRLEPGCRIEDAMEQLRGIPGIGEWTAQYIAMRALSWPDAFPHTDLGIRKALGTDRAGEILALAEKWRPWRAYAALHLWTNPAGKRPLVFSPAT